MFLTERMVLVMRKCRPIHASVVYPFHPEVLRAKGEILILCVLRSSYSRRKIQALLASADIRIDGDRPWDMHVVNEQLYDRVLRDGSLGLGEAYMDGWWESGSIDQLFDHLLTARLDAQTSVGWNDLFRYLGIILSNRQNIKRAGANASFHYDIGNDLYQAMLDRRMTYSCAYWEGAGSLDDAQENKLEMICRKMNLQKGQRILDIGCGWGSFARYAAEHYPVEVIGITLSREQRALGSQLCQGWPVELRLQDYRELKEKFDHIVSIGMIEHVGARNYPLFMQVVHRNLLENGVFLLHTIGGTTSVRSIDPWIDRYIFPHAVLPSVQQLARAAEGLFVLEDLHNIGVHYDPTLMAWFANFNRAWDELKKKYSDRFYRMWKYYLLSCAGSFRARKNQVWQMVWSRRGLREGFNRGYHSFSL